MRWGVSETNKCVLCDDGIETKAHFSHDFPFSALIGNGLIPKWFL